VSDPDRSPADLAARLLDIALRYWPQRRRDGAVAMRAELAGLTEPSARRRFAFGCATVVLRQVSVLAVVGRALMMLAAGTVAVVVAAGIGDVRMRAESIGAVVVVLVVGWFVARWLPVGPGWLVSVVRGGGLVLVAAELGNAVYDWRYWPRVDIHGARLIAFLGAPIEVVLLLAHLVAVLVVTSRRAAIPGRMVALAAGVGTAAALGSFVPALLHGAVTPSAAGPVEFALLAGSITTFIAGWRTGRPRVTVQLGLWAAAVGALGAAVLNTGLFHLFPHWVPHIVDRVVPAGTSAADVLADNELEAGDPFVGVYLLSALLAIGVLVTLARRASRPRVHVGRSVWRALGSRHTDRDRGALRPRS